nr:RNA-directed DNA polymerase, eukaryota [Tanacetum cinerariifolium]
WFFDLNGDGRFCVKDVRCLLDDVFLPKAEVSTRWIKSIPIKINIFAWKLCLDRLPTRVNLAKRNVAVASLLCPLCDSGMEDAAHLFFRCDMAKDMMFLVSRWWDLEDRRAYRAEVNSHNKKANKIVSLQGLCSLAQSRHKYEEMLRLQARGTMTEREILGQSLGESSEDIYQNQGLSQLATLFPGSTIEVGLTSGTASASRDPSLSGNVDPSFGGSLDGDDDDDDGDV